MALDPNIANFLRNRQSQFGAPAQPSGAFAVPELSPNDLLGSFGSYNAMTDAPLPGSVGNPTGAASPAMDSSYYLNLIQNDPLYKQAIGDLSAQGIADASHTGAQVLRGLVDRGVVPDFTSVAGKLGLSPDIVNWISKNVDLGTAKALADQANKSGVSQEAQLEHQHALNRGNIADSLAARGILRSGANSFLNGEEERNYTGAQYKADQSLADYISGAYTAFTNAERARQDQLRAAASDAAQRQLSLIGSATPPSAPPPPPAPNPNLIDASGAPKPNAPNSLAALYKLLNP